MTTTSAAPKAKRGISIVYLTLEVKRGLTRAITIFFCVVMPVAFYLAFGSMTGMSQVAGQANANAIILVLMGIYGAAMTASTESITIATERPLGWNRELRLTPLRPWSYIATKALTSLIVSIVAVLILWIVALILGKATMPAWAWLAAFGIAMLSAMTFIGLGQFIALFSRPDMTTGLMIPILMACSILSGVFAIPLSGTVLEDIQRWIPMGGLANLTAHLFGNLMGSPDDATFGLASATVPLWADWLNIIGWIIIFTTAAVWAYAHDTKRQ